MLWRPSAAQQAQRSACRSHWAQRRSLMWQPGLPAALGLLRLLGHHLVKQHHSRQPCSSRLLGGHPPCSRRHHPSYPLQQHKQRDPCRPPRNSTSSGGRSLQVPRRQAMCSRQQGCQALSIAPCVGLPSAGSATCKITWPASATASGWQLLRPLGVQRQPALRPGKLCRWLGPCPTLRMQHQVVARRGKQVVRQRPAMAAAQRMWGVTQMWGRTSTRSSPLS